MYQAANFCGTIAFKVYEVTQGKRKSVKGYSFKICDNKKNRRDCNTGIGNYVGSVALLLFYKRG